MRSKICNLIEGLLCVVFLSIVGCGGSVENVGPPDSKTSLKDVSKSAYGSTKAKVFLANGNDSFAVISDGTTVYGGTGYADYVSIVSGTVGVNIDQNVEYVYFYDTPISSFTFLQTGNVLNVYDATGNTLVLSIPPQTLGTNIVFDFTHSISFFSFKLVNGVMTLGGYTISTTTPAPITLIPIPFTNAMVSGKTIHYSYAIGPIADYIFKADGTVTFGTTSGTWSINSSGQVVINWTQPNASSWLTNTLTITNTYGSNYNVDSIFGLTDGSSKKYGFLYIP